MSISKRKNDHIDICLNSDVESTNTYGSWSRYSFIHNAFPEMNYDDISLDSKFINQNIEKPLMIGAMSGGSSKYLNFNKNLALACQEKNWSMSVGSMRSYLEEKKYRDTFNIRLYAPNILLFANIGAVQLNYGLTLDHCKLLVDSIEADGLVFHINSIQEIIQNSGNNNFSNLYKKIEHIKSKINVPIGVKEVGWGISEEVANNLISLGIDFIDVAGASGTSWSRVEAHRSSDEFYKLVAEPFNSWGISTIESIKNIKKHSSIDIISSGGITNGLDAAKTIALGASISSFSKAFLPEAIMGPENVINKMNIIEEQMKICLFATGNKTVLDLKDNNSIIVEK